ncbi:arginase family protein [Rhodovulum sulfidophilum]|uniref:arginase family protein n=1 Tax=Rhodovulum sulfidophilum TaxID=35806 RepID=UPI0019236869|nr:arginase family protein [Rhodovulum sulfidophilum]MBL3565448.1 arginase family protein [Rhodovulum sulfidophilum]
MTRPTGPYRLSGARGRPQRARHGRGAQAIGAALARQSGTVPVPFGTSQPALNAGWRTELAAARPALGQIQARIDAVLAGGAVSVAATGRCAASLATLPVVARHHPGACILWLDAHGDLNTPETSGSGDLGGMALSGPAGLWKTGLGAGQIVLAGSRDLDPAERDLTLRHAIPVIPPGADMAAALRSVIAGRPVYVHLDCDALRPGIVPTEYAVEGGLSLDELNACTRVIAEHRLPGLEIAEFEAAWKEGIAQAAIGGARAPLSGLSHARKRNPAPADGRDGALAHVAGDSPRTTITLRRASRYRRRRP